MNGAANVNLFSDHQEHNADNANVVAAPSNGTVEPIVREPDWLMPIANVIRIMRRVLPPHARLSDDAKETIQECVSEYISLVTGEANERCQLERRKTITAEDMIRAMSNLGFNDYVYPLTYFLHRYRETDGANRASIRGDPLPLQRTRSSTGLPPLQQPSTTQMAMQAPQPPLYYHFGAHGDDAYGGSNSGDLDPYAYYK